MNIPQNIKRIDTGVFEGCAITEAEIPDGVKSIGDFSFSWCKHLEKVIIPESVKLVDEGAFYQSGAIKLVILPDGLDISKTEIPETAAQIKYRKTANGVEITEIICGNGKNYMEIPKEICGIPVIPFGEDISSRAGIYEESEEI